MVGREALQGTDRQQRLAIANCPDLDVHRAQRRLIERVGTPHRGCGAGKTDVRAQQITHPSIVKVRLPYLHQAT